MRRALRMEWTKLRTIRSTSWSMLALVAATIAVSGFAAARIDPTDCSPRPCTLDTVRIALSGVYIGQIAVVTLAATASPPSTTRAPSAPRCRPSHVDGESSRPRQRSSW